MNRCGYVSNYKRDILIIKNPLNSIESIFLQIFFFILTLCIVYIYDLKNNMRGLNYKPATIHKLLNILEFTKNNKIIEKHAVYGSLEYNSKHLLCK